MMFDVSLHMSLVIDISKIKKHWNKLHPRSFSLHLHLCFLILYSFIDSFIDL